MKLYNSKKDVVSSVAQENGRYTIVTNAEDNFWNSDSVTFVYEPFAYLYDERSSFDIEATVQSLKASTQQASAGIMIRSAVSDTAANIFLFVRRSGVFLTWRNADGKNTCFTGARWKDGLTLPCSLRLHAAGNMITAYYRYGEMTEWARLAGRYVELGMNPAAGAAAYSKDLTQTAEAVLDGLIMSVQNSEPVKVERKEEVRTLSDDVLFFEDFENGILNAYPEGRYCFSKIRAANILPTVGADGRETLAWYKDHMSGSHFAGSKHWADYAFSLKLRFDESCIKEEANTFAAYVRHREMDFYGIFHYGVYLTNGTVLRLCKTFTQGEQVLVQKELPYLQDLGTWHDLRIEAFDNRITVYWDRKEVLSYTDEELNICPVGGIGFMTDETAVWLDELAVYELEDALGGAYDNLIGGLWDQPAPADFVYNYEDGMRCDLSGGDDDNPEDAKEAESIQKEEGAAERDPAGADTAGGRRQYRILYTGNTWQAPNDIVTLFGDRLGIGANSVAVKREADERTDAVSYVPGAGYDYICEKEGYVSWAKEDALSEHKEDTASEAAAAWQTCPIVQKTEQGLKFRLPADMQEGIYAVRVLLTDGTEEIAYLNLPRIHFVLGDEGEVVTPGGNIRVCGENICLAAAPEGARLYLKNEKHEYMLEAIRSEPDHMAEFVLPEDAVYGRYEVTVHNGYGGGSCWSVPKTITVGASPRDSWPTEVFNVKEYGAKGLGCRYNDTPGFLTALRAAEANGGGIVLVPRGTYMLTHPITIPEKVRLLGEGIIESKIIWYPYNWDTDELPHYAVLMKSNVEIADIDFSGTRLGPLFVTRGRNRRNIYIHDCRVFMTPYNGGPTDAHPTGNGWESYQLRGMISRERNFWTLKYGYITFKIEGVNNVQIYNNDTDTETGGLALARCRNAYVAHNTITGGLRLGRSTNVLVEYCDIKATSALSGDNIYFAHNELSGAITNNREIMTTDGGGYFEHSGKHYICAAGGGGREYELPFPFVEGSLIASQVLILEGPGEGQMRRIVANEGNRITLDSPFAVRPVDGESKMYILDARSNIIAASNHLYNSGDFQFYGTQLNSIVTQNEFEKVRGFVARGASPLYGFSQPNWYISLVDNHFWDANFLHHNGWASSYTKPMCKVDILAGGSQQASKNIQLCTLLRDNVLEDGFYIAVGSGKEKGLYVGLTVQRNQVSRAEKAIVCTTNADCEGMLFADNVVENSEVDYKLPQAPEFFQAAPGTDSPKYRYL